MNKTIHITFGDSGYGILKYFFDSNDTSKDILDNNMIINLSDDYSLGPLLDISTESGLNNRIKWFNESLMNMCYDELYEGEKCGDRIANGYASLSKIDDSDKIVIWHGENTSDQIALRYIVSKFRKNIIAEADITNTFIEKEGNNYYPISLAECDYNMVEEAIVKISTIDDFRKEKLIYDLSILEDSSKTLRIYYDKVIEEVDEDYYDKLIISNCSYNYKNAAVVIGFTMGRTNQLVCDTYIHCRVIKLIELGKVIYRGDKNNLRNLEIKQESSLKDFLESIFGSNEEADEDGIYHYLLENKNNELTIETTDISKWNSKELSNKMIIDYNDENILSLSLRIEGNSVIFINNIEVSNARIERFEYEDVIDGNLKKILEESIFIRTENNSSETIIIKLSPIFTVGLI